MLLIPLFLRKKLFCTDIITFLVTKLELNRLITLCHYITVTYEKRSEIERGRASKKILLMQKKNSLKV